MQIRNAFPEYKQNSLVSTPDSSLDRAHVRPPIAEWSEVYQGVLVWHGSQIDRKGFNHKDEVSK